MQETTYQPIDNNSPNAPMLESAISAVSPALCPGNGNCIQGKPIVRGSGIGHATLLSGDLALTDAPLNHTQEHSLQLSRLERAYEITFNALQKCRKEISQVLEEADVAIFDMHMALLQDISLRQRIRSFLDEGYTLEAALSLTYKAYESEFNEIEDEYLRERLQDIEDTLLRLLNAACNQQSAIQPFSSGCHTILVTRELFPSQLTSIPFSHIGGIICETGGNTSHAAILARALRIPMVVNIPEVQRLIHPGDTVLVDGTQGLCIINPDDNALENYHQKVAITSADRDFNAGLPDEIPADDNPCTIDGTCIRLCGNVTLTSEINALHRAGIREIGLYRTEFMFMIRNSMPDEERQLLVLKRLIANADGAPVTIRALDIGGDKQLPYIKWAPELNPSLGWRGLRYLLSNPEIFKPHLRAILRACRAPNVALLFPMVSDKADIIMAKQAVENARCSLEADGLPYGTPKIGMMLEVPSAVFCLEQLLPEVDFVSIGTNDLVQYLFAADRSNSLVAQWFDAYHPVIFTLLGQISSILSRHPEKELELCGELAGQHLAIPALVGAGLRKLSMNSAVISTVRDVIRHLRLEECRELYGNICKCDNAKAARKLMENFRKTHLHR